MPTTTRRRSPGAGSFLRSTDGGAVSRARIAGAILAACLAVGRGSDLAAQTAPAAPGPAAAAIRAEPSDQSATVSFFNRPIVVLRARVLGRSPAERADAVQRALDELVERGITGPVERQSFAG